MVRLLSGALVFGFILLAGCEDLIKGPPEVPDPEAGRVLITIGGGFERTVLPRTDQFSKIELTFAAKPGTTGTMPPVEVAVGETVITLKPGSWEITASAYNAADPPAVAAQATNTLTRNPDSTISGDTWFALAPAGTGPGILRYTITPPQGIVLDAAKSWIRIEKDGEALATLNEDGFAAGEKALSGEAQGTVSLEPGRYVVDILLDDAANVNTAVCIESVAILPGLVTDLVFAPEAGEFLNPDVRAALTSVVGVNFGKTRNNSSGTVIGASGGAGAGRTQAFSAPNGTETLYFTLTKLRTQTITLSDTPAGSSVVTSGTVDGHTASLTLAVVTVNTAAIAEDGGRLDFTLSLGETGKTPVVYTVAIDIASLTSMSVESWQTKWVYMIGEPFDPAGLSLTGTYSDGTKKPVTGGYTVRGFDSSSAGECIIEIEKQGIVAVYRRSNGTGLLETATDITIEILPLSERALVFYHGYTEDYEPMSNKYTVPVERTLVLAPVKYYIPDNAVYEWKVDGVLQGGYTTEYFSYTAASSSGEHTVTVAAKVDGSEIASGSTTVVCTGAAIPRPKQTDSRVEAVKLYSVVAPGQFGSGSDRLGDMHGAGGYGGYPVFKFDHSVTRQPGGEEIAIGGNAFGGWIEPGAIWVSQDDNGNGEPDDTWYELKGSHTFAPLTLRRYAITWRRNSGATTWVDNLGNGGNWRRSWHDAPSSLDEITLAGTLLGQGGTYVAENMWGYADVNDNGRVSLSNAIQADGSPVDLAFIDFLKIVTALHFEENAVGERSTEANTPRDRSFPNSANQILQSEDLGEEHDYTYTFTNTSGYDVTVEILDTEETITLAKGSASVPTVVTKTIRKYAIYIDYYGGNVGMTRVSGGAKFYDK
jgi:hypothetical protein